MNCIATTAHARANGAVRAIAAAALAGCLLAAAPLANAASSASFQIPASSFDVAGGVSSSANHQVVSCVGSEVAGSATSASYRVDSGCGPALGFVSVPVALEDPVPVPGPTGGVAAALAALLAMVTVLLMRSRRFMPRAPRRQA